MALRRLLWVTLALALIGVATAGGVLWKQGYRIYVIHTGSMTPTYRPGDVVIDRPAQKHYRPGEVITFRHSAFTTDLVTHRITRITAAGLIHTKGDANPTADVWEIRPDQVQGSTIVGVPRLGYLLIYLKQPAGVASIATGIFGLVLLWTLFFPPEPAPEPAEPGLSPAERGAHRAGDEAVANVRLHELTWV